MPVPKRRRCRSRRDRGRTHKKLQAVTAVKCKHCGATRRPHQVCPQCGTYKGREYRATVTS